jgi:gamma-glutamyl-gamma-aminobutyrate hydrolase PuuD
MMHLKDLKIEDSVVVRLSWHPEKAVSLDRYKDMVFNYVYKDMDNIYANSIPIKEFSLR